MVSEILLRRRFDIESMMREINLLWDAFFLKKPKRKVEREWRRFCCIDVSEDKVIGVKIKQGEERAKK